MKDKKKENKRSKKKKKFSEGPESGAVHIQLSLSWGTLAQNFTRQQSKQTGEQGEGSQAGTINYTNGTAGCTVSRGRAVTLTPSG